MTYAHEPDDPEEDRRLRGTAEQGAAIRMDALRAAAAAGSFEFVFLRRSPATFDAFDFVLLDKLAWHYRRRLPRYLAPKLNPDDPIVRQAHG